MNSALKITQLPTQIVFCASRLCFTWSEYIELFHFINTFRWKTYMKITFIMFFVVCHCLVLI